MVTLLIGGALLIWQNTKEMRKEIVLDALTFGELTNDKIITSFEQFYLTENFLQFRKDLNPLLSKNVDISRIEILGKTDELFYDSDVEKDVAYLGDKRTHSYDLNRIRDIKPSLLYEDGQIVFVKKTNDNEWLAVNAAESVIPFPVGKVLNVIVPHKNARLSVAYTLSYEALTQRIIWMAVTIAAVLLGSIILVSFVSRVLAGRFVRPIQDLEKGVVRIGKGALGTQVKISSDDEIGVLAENFNQMSIKLKKDTEELLIKEAMTKELNIAREIQENMLPKQSPEVPGLDLAGSLTPATTIGGDIYDFLPLKDKGTYIFIADVTGHGVPAGMIANVTHSTLYCFSQVFEKTDEIMKAMNGVIHSKTKRNMFATALLARWNEKTKNISYCNAGHEQILAYNATAKKTTVIGKGGMALGMIADLKSILKEQSVDLQSGDVLMFYTDGIPEAWRTEKENLGMERLIELATKACEQGRDARSIRDNLLASVNAFRNNYPQQDDITLVVMKAI